MKSKNEIIYSLNIKDIQDVALEEIERELDDNEIEIVTESIGIKINWYEAILNSITENLKLKA